MDDFFWLISQGLLLNTLAASFSSAAFIVTGPLQRFSLCYLVCALMFVFVRLPWQRLFLFALIALYLSLMYGWAFPATPACSLTTIHQTLDQFLSANVSVQEGSSPLTVACNACAYIDQAVYGSTHMRMPTDPNGVLSSCGAIVTTYLGLEAGRIVLFFQHELAARRQRRIGSTSTTPRHAPRIHTLPSLYGSVILYWPLWTAFTATLGGIAAIWEQLNHMTWSISFSLSSAAICWMVMCFIWMVTEDAQETQGQRTAPSSSPSTHTAAYDSVTNEHSFSRVTYGSEHGVDVDSSAMITRIPATPNLLQAAPETPSSEWCSGCNSQLARRYAKRALLLGYAAVVSSVLALGRNPLVIYTGMQFLLICMKKWARHVPAVDSTAPTLWEFLYQHGVLSWVHDDAVASSIFAVAHLLVWTLIASFLDRRKWYFKV